jgi:hypothetical protein
MLVSANVLLVLLHPMLLAGRLMLPDHVGGPGAGNVALGAGVERLAPALDVRWGVVDALALTFEGVWNAKAPRLGVQLRTAAGRSRGTLFALAWAEGHLRPVLTTEVTDAFAGGDLGGGLGVVAVQDWVAVGLDGGVALGLPVGTVAIPDLDPTQIDQQGGVFGVQRGFIAVDLGDHLEVAVHASFAVPIQSVSFKRRNEDLVGQWDVRLGGRVLTRF